MKHLKVFEANNNLVNNNFTDLRDGVDDFIQNSEAYAKLFQKMRKLQASSWVELEDHLKSLGYDNIDDDFLEVLFDEFWRRASSDVEDISDDIDFYRDTKKYNL